jgi:hypothetical protein
VALVSNDFSPYYKCGLKPATSGIKSTFYEGTFGVVFANLARQKVEIIYLHDIAVGGVDFAGFVGGMENGRRLFFLDRRIFLIIGGATTAY